MADRIVGAVRDAGSGAEEVDPAIKAFNEVAQPMARGYSLLVGGDGSKRQEGWLRRIHTSVAGLRKEEGLFNKVASKRLKAIEEKPVAEAGGNGGLFASLLMALRGIGPAIMAAMAGLIGKLGGGLGGLAKGAGGLLKGGLKRVPLLGSLLSIFGAASDISGSEGDESLSRREKDQRAGKAVGGAAGSIGGMMAGAAAGAFLGPVGAIIGGAVGAFLGDQAGQIIGDKVGGWANDLRAADIPGKIGAAWDATTGFVASAWGTALEGMGKSWNAVTAVFSAVGDGIGKAWGSFVDTARSGWDSFAGMFTSVIDALKRIPVIGPEIEAAQAALKKAADAAGGVVTGAKEMAGAAATAVKEKAVELGTKAAEGVKSGVEYLGNNTTVGKGIKAAGQGAAAIAEKAPAAAERAYNVTAAAAGSALEAIMPKGYRHKALFDGIKGGDSLTKYGSYTDEEAALVRELKTSGANTSANVKGGMSLEVQDKISAQAKRAGLDPVMMQKIAAMESGGNANAISSTGAIGIYQFTGQTASGVGIKNRFDVDQNIEGGMKLTKQNQAMLEDAKLPVTAENLYMMHQLGPKAAKEVIRGAASGKSKEELSADTQKAMNLNYGAKSKTAADYIATNKKALDDRYAAVTKDAGGAQTGDVAGATQAINGGQNGISHRKELFAKYQKEGVGSTAPEAPGAATAVAKQEAAAKPSEDDITNGGRLEFKDIGGGDVQVTDNDTGVTELASPEQSKAFRKQRGKEYLDALAQANNPDNYKPGAAPIALQAPQAPVVASVQAPSVPSAPSVAAPPEAPPVAVPLASNSQRPSVTIAQAAQDAGQDLRDRGIAHIVTGGLSGA